MIAAAPTAILFDIDGTLISTGGAGTRSWRGAFEKLYGVAADIGKYSEAGMTDPTVGRLTFAKVIGREPSTAEMAQLMAAYLDRLPQEVQASERYRVLTGVKELLARLCESGVLLGITTGALEAAAHIKLARGDLNRYFTFGGYGSDADDRIGLTCRALERGSAILGSTLDPSTVVVVGDTPLDVEAARGVGAIAVAVATGRYSADELQSSGAEYILASLAEPFPSIPSQAQADRIGVARADSGN